MGAFSNLIGLSRQQPSSSTEQRLVGRFHEFWDELRGGQRYPCPSSLKSEDIAEFMPHAFTIDLSQDRGTPRIRFAGKELIAECGEDLGNRTIAEVPRQTLIFEAIRRFYQVVTDGKPLFVSDSFRNRHGNEVLFRAVMMPFSRTGSDVDYVVGVVNCKVLPAATVSGPIERTETAAPAVPQEQEPVQAAPLPETVPGKVPADDPVAVAPGGTATAPEAAPVAARKPRPLPPKRGRLIVVGGVEPRCGATTAVVHLAVELAQAGHAVGILDLDGTGRGLSVYMAKRRAHAERSGVDHRNLAHAELPTDPDAAWLLATLCDLLNDHDRVLVDLGDGGSDLVPVVLGLADTVVTVLGAADSGAGTSAARLADHAACIAGAQATRLGDTGPFSWIVLRNRRPASGKADAGVSPDVPDILASAGAFRSEAGLADRALYAELSERGLTLCELRGGQCDVPLSMGHIAARQELRSLAARLRL